MLAEFEKRIAFALVEFLQAEDILVKCDRLFDVADFDGDVIAAIDLNAHLLIGLGRRCGDLFGKGDDFLAVGKRFVADALSPAKPNANSGMSL